MSDFSYNQKEVLFKTIRCFVRANRARSLLDIGAGDGMLATRLAKLVPTYVAVEKNKRHISLLKKAGMSVVEKTFPTGIDGQFDVVLISHALPELKKSYKKFLEEAWKRVKRGGTLLIITFKGSDDGVAALNRLVRGRDNKIDKELYRTVVAILNRFGNPKFQKITSTMKSKNIGVLLKILSSLIGVKEKREENCLKKVLETKFETRGGYSFTTPHLVISVKKS